MIYKANKKIFFAKIKKRLSLISGGSELIAEKRVKADKDELDMENANHRY